MVPASFAALDQIRSGVLGRPLTAIAEFREYWGGIFDAHPWLSGPSDSYLGFWRRGGGASGEHSHAINIWQFFARALGAGRITEVAALLDYADQDGTSYDRHRQLHVRTEERLAEDHCSGRHHGAVSKVGTHSRRPGISRVACQLSKG